MSRNHWITVGALAAGLALLTFLGWKFFVHPLAAEYDAAVAQEQTLDQQLQTDRATEAQFGKFKVQAENMSRELDFYNSRVDGSLDTASVIDLITDLARPLNLEQWTISVVPPAPGRVGASSPGIARYGIEVKFQSDFESLGTFLNACVSQRRIIVPEGVSLRAFDDPAGLYNDTLSVDLTLAIYGGQSGPGVRR